MVRKIRARAFLLLLVIGSSMLGGCVAIRPAAPQEKTQAFAHPEQTELGRLLAPRLAAHPGLSGFKLLENGREALVARIALADAAERTIDAQYYICDPDAAGSFFFQRLIVAAERGVRVRLLLDDNNLRDDREMATLCQHPNIEVRVFNPFKYRARWARLPQYAFDFNRMVRRMHNKIFISDNAISIIGGRNIGNNYFSLDAESNFRDFDLLVAGPLTRDASQAFDEYWNSAWAIDALRLVRHVPTEAEAEALKQRLAERVQSLDGFMEEHEERSCGYLQELVGRDALVWAQGEIICEPPRKIEGASRETTQVSARLEQECQQTEKELLVEMAYLIPTRELSAQLNDLRRRGVEIKIMTSALEAVDVSLVFAYYKKYRQRLLEAGIELHEYKAHAGLSRSERRWYRPRSTVTSLHTKAMVFDHERVYIGSANLDARSVSLNTEIAVLVRSPQLARQLAAYLAEDFSAQRSWRVELHSAWRFRPDRMVWREEKFLTWTGWDNGRLATHHFEHAAGVWQRTKAFLYSLIPGIEPQL